MAQLIVPTRQKDDALTTLMKGLNIASQVYGIRTNMAQLDDIQQRQQGQQNIAEGKYDKNQQLELSKSYNLSSEKPTTGNYREITDLETGSPLYASTRQESSPIIKEIKGQKNGIAGTVIKDYRTGKEIDFIPDAIKTREIKNIDDLGNETISIVEDRPGQKFTSSPKPNPTEAKSAKEAAYRYNALTTNAAKLKDLIKQYGTTELAGPASSQMDSLIYQMAVDQAKLVDPDSVAREGEVAAAQKYMLPVRDWGGFGTSNKTAISLIDNYVKDLNSRIESRQEAFGAKSNSNLKNNYTFEKQAVPDGTALAAPANNPILDQLQERARNGDKKAAEYLKSLGN